MSSRRYLWRRHLDSKMAAPEMTSTKTWGEFFDPYCGGGGKWRPFRFRPPSWMTSFPGVPGMRSSKMATGSGRAAIFSHRHNSDRKTLPILLMYIPYTSSVICRICNGSVFQYWRSCTPSRSIGECAVPELNATFFPLVYQLSCSLIKI